MSATVKKLSNAEIEKRLKKLPEWVPNAKHTELSRSFSTPTFLSGLSFIARVAVHAEIVGHHPVIEFSYNKVKIKLTTNSLKSLSRLDFELAKRIDGLKQK